MIDWDIFKGGTFIKFLNIVPAVLTHTDIALKCLPYN